ncbi:response regulator transcription factor [Dokdonella ginsengisoli]|uniref:Response regulator transcription factor n=1 Tax=Dokdonella ginsengisoli TaxID=363846 RepID=A0ABV9QS68_9GAMM
MPEAGAAAATRTSPRARVAVLEDDEALREDILVPGLAANGYDVEGFGHASDLYRRLLATAFDVAVIDVGLPDEDGLSVARHLRAGSPLGIVMLTGRSRPAERLRALDDGADAWLAKPVEVEVVAATIGSLLRRMRLPAVARAPVPAPAPASASRWRLAAQGWRLAAPSGRDVVLNRAERGVLECLFAANGEPVPREQLIAALGESRYEFDPHRLDMLVHRLRRKVVENTGQTLPLRSVRGRGYVLVGCERSPAD